MHKIPLNCITLHSSGVSLLQLLCPAENIICYHRIKPNQQGPTTASLFLFVYQCRIYIIYL